MELDDALMKVSEIRLQIARSEAFRGYRSATAAFSGLMAVAAAIVQPLVVPEPVADAPTYLMLWIAAALLCIAATAAEMTFRCRRSQSPTAGRMTWLAVEQFLPSLIAGAVITLVLAIAAVDSLWLLPGLWGILFSLGIFSSARLLPRAIVWVALYYLACGAGCLVWAQGPRAFSPWAMGLTFGGGQFFAALVLYVTLERDHGCE